MLSPSAVCLGSLNLALKTGLGGDLLVFSLQWDPEEDGNKVAKEIPWQQDTESEGKGENPSFFIVSFNLGCCHTQGRSVCSKRSDLENHSEEGPSRLCYSSRH